MEMLQTYLPIILFGILGVCLVLGLLFGLGRGLKRSLIRLGILLGFFLLVFFLTPLISNWVFSWNIVIAGHTPAGWVEELTAALQEDMANDALSAVMVYLTDYAVSLAFAVFSLLISLVLYLVIKPLSWIIFAIIAPFAAPKKDKDGKRLPRHRGWGLLVGLLQGLVVFFFLTMPLNGLLNIAGEVAAARDHQERTVPQTQSVAVDESDHGMDVGQLMSALDAGSAGYRMVLRYTGMEFLTDRAFEYQTTMRLDSGTHINLRKDIISILQLVQDYRTYQTLLNKVNNSIDANDGDIWLGLTVLDAKDYQLIEDLTNRIFDLELLKIGDDLMGNVDQLLRLSLDGEQTKLAGTELVESSAYGVLVKNLAQDEHRNEFFAGVEAMVKYVAGENINLVRQQFLHMLKMTQEGLTTMIDYPDAKHQQPVMVALTRPKLTTQDYLEILLTPIDDERIVWDLLYDDYLDTPFIKILAQPKAENCIIYTKLLDGLDEASGMAGAETFARDFLSMFFGNQAFVEGGAWETLSATAKSVLTVARDHVNIMDDLEAIQQELLAADPNLTQEQVLPQAIVQYLSNLLDKSADKNTQPEQYYAKVDNLATGLHNLIFAFQPVTDFIAQQVPTLGLGQFNEIFTTLLDTTDVEIWVSTFRNLIGVSDLLANNSVVKQILSIDFSEQDAPQQLLQAVATMDAGDVADLAFDLLQIDAVGKAVDEALQNFDFGFDDQSEVGAKVTELKDFLTTDLKDAEMTTAEKREKLREIVGDLWSLVNAA